MRKLRTSTSRRHARPTGAYSISRRAEISMMRSWPARGADSNTHTTVSERARNGIHPHASTGPEPALRQQQPVCPQPDDRDVDELVPDCSRKENIAVKSINATTGKCRPRCMPAVDGICASRVLDVRWLVLAHRDRDQREKMN